MRKFLAFALSLMLVCSSLSGAVAGITTVSRLSEIASSVIAYGPNAVFIGTNAGNVYQFTESAGVTGSMTRLANLGQRIDSMTLAPAQSVLYVGLADGSFTTVAITPVAGYGIFKAGGPVSVTLATSAGTITSSDLVQGIDYGMVQEAAGNSYVGAVNVGSQSISISEAANGTGTTYYYAAIRKGLYQSSWDVVALGSQAVNNASTNAVVSITNPALTSSDLVFTQLSGAANLANAFITTAITGTNNFVATFNAATNVSVNQINYVVLRPSGVNAPVGYVSAAGNLTSIAGTAANYTVSGILTTDIPIVYVQTAANNTAMITSAQVTAANTLNITFAASPLTSATLIYTIFRSY